MKGEDMLYTITLKGDEFTAATTSDNELDAFKEADKYELEAGQSIEITMTAPNGEDVTIYKKEKWNEADNDNKWLSCVPRERTAIQQKPAIRALHPSPV